MNIDLTNSELEIFRKSIVSSLSAGIDFYSNSSVSEFVPVAQEIAVLSKVNQALGEELGADEDSDATNDTVLSDWN